MTKQEIIRLLEKEDGEEIASLFARAREVRKANIRNSGTKCHRGFREGENKISL